MPKSLQESAKRGNIKALEALMSKSFESQGVTVQVASKNTLLKVALKGRTAPPQSMAAQVKKGLITLSPKGFERVMVTAKTIGEGQNWHEYWKFSAPDATQPVETRQSSIPTGKVAIVAGFAVAGLVGLGLLSAIVGGVMNAMDNGASDIEAALVHAEGANSLTENADSETEWRIVAGRWSDAIADLREVPENSELRQQADAKIAEFEVAHQQAVAEADKFAVEKLQADRERAQVARASTGEAINIFREGIRSVDPTGALVTRVSLSEFDDEGKTVVIEVASGWHYQPKAAREDAATGFYTLWIASRSAAGLQTDQAYMRIKSASGKEVGGWGPIKGIYIKD